MIAIIDYGVGNLASVANALERLGHEACISSDPEVILAADKVILPGVGAFADAMQTLHSSGLEPIVKNIIQQQTPLLGVCLGMQLLLSESEEDGLHPGLDIIKGRVVRFQLPSAFKVPHMGWNQVQTRKDSRLFRDIPEGSYFYFVHSYYVVPENQDCVAARCSYGHDFVCALERDSIYATQFHPEKSGEIGLKVLNNFATL